MNIYTLLHIKQRPHKDLLYSTGKYTQYYAVTYKGKEKTFVFVTESFCCTSEPSTAL